MQFSNYIWSLYLNSVVNYSNIELFDNFKSAIYDVNLREKLKRILNSFRLIPFEDDGFNFFFDCLIGLFEQININEILSLETSIEKFQYIMDLTFEDGIEKVFQFDDVEVYSSLLFLIDSNNFFPYFFKEYFFILKQIFEELGINLPLIPKKNDYQARAYYYYELCTVLKEYCSLYDIKFSDIPVFLYDFAVKQVKKYKIESIELQKPKRAYFVGGGKNSKDIDSSGDFDYLDKANHNSIHFWQCNENVQPGDIVVMYCLAPRSSIHSIWRAVSPGFIDPFFYFYKITYIGFPLIVPKIKLIEMSSDILLKEMPIIKCNMQGINGKNIEKKYYDRIIQIIKSKAQSHIEIPKLEEDIFRDYILENEKDVEKYLLEPLLVRLGYTPNDWIRQMTLKMGRGEKVFPDYAVLPVCEHGNESSKWVCEAKYSIKSIKQLKKDFDQTKSYALRLSCEMFSIVAKEGVWCSIKTFNFKEIKFYSWNDLSKNEFFNELYDIFGRKKAFY